MGNYPWIHGWINNIKEILRKKLIQGKQQVEIPVIEEEVKNPDFTEINAVKGMCNHCREHQHLLWIDDKNRLILFKWVFFNSSGKEGPVIHGAGHS